MWPFPHSHSGCCPLLWHPSLLAMWSVRKDPADCLRVTPLIQAPTVSAKPTFPQVSWSGIDPGIPSSGLFTASHTHETQTQSSASELLAAGCCLVQAPSPRWSSWCSILWVLEEPEARRPTPQHHLSLTSCGSSAAWSWRQTTTGIPFQGSEHGTHIQVLRPHRL